MNPLAAAGQIDPTVIGNYASGITSIINDYLVPLVFTIALIVFLFGVAKAYILSKGDPGEVKEGHQLILWGIVGFVVMLSVWGLVNIATGTLGIGSGVRPTPPTI